RRSERRTAAVAPHTRSRAESSDRASDLETQTLFLPASSKCNRTRARDPEPPAAASPPHRAIRARENSSARRHTQSQRRAAEQPEAESGLARAAGHRCFRGRNRMRAAKHKLARKIQKRCAHKRYNDQSVRKRIARDFFNPVKNLHRCYARVIEHQRHAQFRE